MPADDVRTMPGGGGGSSYFGTMPWVTVRRVPTQIGYVEAVDGRGRSGRRLVRWQWETGRGADRRTGYAPLRVLAERDAGRALLLIVRRQSAPQVVLGGGGGGTYGSGAGGTT